MDPIGFFFVILIVLAVILIILDYIKFGYLDGEKNEFMSELNRELKESNRDEHD